jgi:hypothetical protein
LIVDFVRFKNNLYMMRFYWFVIFLVQYFSSINAKWVRDVDSKIIDEIQQNPSIAYLIQFHAPWFVCFVKFNHE